MGEVWREMADHSGGPVIAAVPPCSAISLHNPSILADASADSLAIANGLHGPAQQEEQG
jgi:hypothetical protein